MSLQTKGRERSEGMKYLEACHAMQTGVAIWMNHDPHETEPKHLRVGVNSAMCDNAGLAKLLVEKGLITYEEHEKAITESMIEEVQRYTKRIEDITGKKVMLE